MTNRNATLVKDLYGLFETGDVSSISEFLTDDVVVHVPGRHPMAGDYKGREGFLEFMAKNFELAGPSLHIELEAVVADDERAVTFEHFTARRDGKVLDVRDHTAFLFRDGKVAEMVMLSEDPYAHDEFWA